MKRTKKLLNGLVKGNNMTRFTVFHSNDLCSNVGSKKVAFQLRKTGDKPSLVFHNKGSTSYLVLPDKTYQLSDDGKPKIYSKNQQEEYIKKYFT